MTTTTQKTQIEFHPDTVGKTLESDTMGYTFYLEKDVDADNLPERQFKALGRTTWFLCAAPTTPFGGFDLEQGGPVEEWDFAELDAEQLKELFEIQARLFDAANGHFWYK